jgi:hypothetical protein
MGWLAARIAGHLGRITGCLDVQAINLQKKEAVTAATGKAKRAFTIPSLLHVQSLICYHNKGTIGFQSQPA